MNDLERYEIECLREESCWDFPLTKEEQYWSEQDQFIEQGKLNQGVISALMRCSVDVTISYINKY